MNDFSQLQLSQPILDALQKAEYKKPTQIQEQAIPVVLEGKDVLGVAQTGTGKTAAFLLPLLEKLSQKRSNQGIQVLILSPTRELAAQIGESFDVYAKFLSLKQLVIFGGVKQGPQVTALKKGIDVLIATPGRLLDLQGQGYISLQSVSFFILDEADRMLDMGFMPDIRRVLSMLPQQRQNLLFSATMPDNIVQLASQFLSNPVRIEVDVESSTVERIDQSVRYVSQSQKKNLLLHLLKELECTSSIVFTRTKHGANRVVKFLVKNGIESAAIHGNKSQNARIQALESFKEGTTTVLVATDIASRGIDVEQVSHVFNYDLPNISETYVHRIGRTARAGESGVAIAFCNEEEAQYLVDIEKLIGKVIPKNEEHEWHCYPALEAVLIAREETKRHQEKKKKTKKRFQSSRKPQHQKRKFVGKNRRSTK